MVRLTMEMSKASMNAAARKSEDSSISNIPKEYRSGTAQFPWMLHQMLEDAERYNFHEIMSWMPCGQLFRVYDREALVQQVLPHYSKQSQYKSFARSLNMWGFSTCRRCCGKKSRGAYFHPQFVRGRLDLAHQMVRIKIKATGRPKCAYCPFKAQQNSLEDVASSEDETAIPNKIPSAARMPASALPESDSADSGEEDIVDDHLYIPINYRQTSEPRSEEQIPSTKFQEIQQLPLDSWENAMRNTKSETIAANDDWPFSGLLFGRVDDRQQFGNSDSVNSNLPLSAMTPEERAHPTTAVLTAFQEHIDDPVPLEQAKDGYIDNNILDTFSSTEPPPPPPPPNHNENTKREDTGWMDKLLTFFDPGDDVQMESADVDNIQPRPILDRRPFNKR